MMNPLDRYGGDIKWMCIRISGLWPTFYVRLHLHTGPVQSAHTRVYDGRSPRCIRVYDQKRAGLNGASFLPFHQRDRVVAAFPKSEGESAVYMCVCLKKVKIKKSEELFNRNSNSKIRGQTGSVRVRGKYMGD